MGWQTVWVGIQKANFDLKSAFSLLFHAETGHLDEFAASDLEDLHTTSATFADFVAAQGSGQADQPGDAADGAEQGFPVDDQIVAVLHGYGFDGRGNHHHRVIALAVEGAEIVRADAELVHIFGVKGGVGLFGLGAGHKGHIRALGCRARGFQILLGVSAVIAHEFRVFQARRLFHLLGHQRCFGGVAAEEDEFRRVGADFRQGSPEVGVAHLHAFKVRHFAAQFQNAILEDFGQPLAVVGVVVHGRNLLQAQLIEDVIRVHNALQGIAQGHPVADIALCRDDGRVGGAGGNEGDAGFCQGRGQAKGLAGAGAAGDGNDCGIGGEFVADDCALIAGASAVFGHQFEQKSFHAAHFVQIVNRDFRGLANVLAGVRDGAGQGEGTADADGLPGGDDHFAGHIRGGGRCLGCRGLGRLSRRGCCGRLLGWGRGRLGRRRAGRQHKGHNHKQGQIRNSTLHRVLL